MMRMIMILLMFITAVSFFGWLGEKTEPVILARLKAGKSVTIGDMIITPHKDWNEENPIFYVWNRNETSSVPRMQYSADKRQDYKTEKTVMVARDNLRSGILDE